MPRTPEGCVDCASESRDNWKRGIVSAIAPAVPGSPYCELHVESRAALREMDEEPDPTAARRDRHARLDRWMEAVLGGRLRYHVDDGPAPGVGAYWSAVYGRWQRLYRAGRSAGTPDLS